MKEKEFLAVLDAVLPVTLSGSGGEIEIEPIVAIKIPKREIVRKSCCVSYAGETTKIKGDKKLIKFLEDAGAAENGEIKVTAIGEDRISVEEYRERCTFDKLDMCGLLEKYLPLADSFSLTCPYGKNGITDEIAAEALGKVKASTFEIAKAQFMRLSEEDMAKLPPFKKIYADIENEYKDYCRQNSVLIEANDGYACFTDVFSGSRTYSSPEELWHVYSAVDFAGTCEYILEKLKRKNEYRPLTAELDGEENKPLKENLLKTEITFIWHCTQSTELSKVFYIKLNEQTAEWLKKFRTDYDLELLEDLAFYKNGKLLFSSCTNERFHVDCSSKN